MVGAGCPTMIPVAGFVLLKKRHYVSSRLADWGPGGEDRCPFWYPPPEDADGLERSGSGPPDSPAPPPFQDLVSSPPAG